MTLENIWKCVKFERRNGPPASNSSVLATWTEKTYFECLKYFTKCRKRAASKKFSRYVTIHRGVLYFCEELYDGKP